MKNIQNFQKIKFDIRLLAFDTAILCVMICIFIKNTFIGNVINLILGTIVAVILNKEILAGITRKIIK